MPRSISLNRRQFLQRMAVFAGVMPLANVAFPLRSSSMSTVARSLAVPSAAHGILILDNAHTPRARFIADSLAEAGFAVAIAGSIAALPRVVSQLQGQAGLSLRALHLIGLGDAIPHALTVSAGNQFATLILDSADASDQDLRLHFAMLKTTSITTLIVHDVTARDTLLRITRFIER